MQIGQNQTNWEKNELKFAAPLRSDQNHWKFKFHVKLQETWAEICWWSFYWLFKQKYHRDLRKSDVKV